MTSALFRSVLVLLSALAALAVPAQCADEAPREVDLSRVISIGGDVTEILYALELEPRIVAVDTTSVFPAEALSKKQSVGYMRALSTEGVLSLSPTLIIANEKAGPPEVIAALKQSSVPYVSIAAPDTPEGTEQRIRAIADAIRAPEKGEILIRDVRQKFEHLAESRAAIAKPVRVLFLLSLQNGRATAAGKATAAHEVISLAGGENVVTMFEGYKPLADEAALELAPDVILVMKRSQQAGGPSEEPAQAIIATMPGLNATPAARNGRIMEVDGAALLQFGPRTASAARDLMNALHLGKQAATAAP